MFIHSEENHENIPFDIQLKIILQIINALEFLHSYKIIHLDIKPANILVEQNTLKIKLTDFGSCYNINNNQIYNVINKI